jgi:hypothetical protein
MTIQTLQEEETEKSVFGFKFGKNVKMYRSLFEIESYNCFWQIIEE